MTVNVFVPFSGIFSSQASDFVAFKSLVKQLSRTDALFWCARLNLILSDPRVDEKTKQGYALALFFDAEEINLINRFVAQYGGTDHVKIFFRGQLLELLRWISLFCNDHCGDGNTFTDFNVRRIFGKCLLLASDLWRSRLFDEASWKGDDLRKIRKETLGTVRLSAGEGSAFIDPERVLGRGYFLFNDIFPQFYDAFEETFFRQTGLTVKEYYTCVSGLLVHYWRMGTHKEGFTQELLTGLFSIDRFVDPATNLGRIYSNYFKLESQSIEGLRESLWGQRTDTDYFVKKYDLRTLRNRPILHSSDGRALIVDPVFFADKVAVGPLFHLLSSEKISANTAFSEFGKAFQTYSEIILRKMYPDTGLQSRLAAPLMGLSRRDGEVEIADACINYFSEVILIEIKATWIQDEKVSSDDYDDFLDHFYERYGKGAIQLANSITRLCTGQVEPRDNTLSFTNRIYPVLLVYDHLAAVFTFVQFLEEKFTSTLEPDGILANGEMQKGRYFVTPLIVMGVEDFEDMETSTKYFALRDLLQDYLIARKTGLLGLHNFILSSDYADKIYRSKTVQTKSLEIMNEVAGLFGS